MVSCDAVYNPRRSTLVMPGAVIHVDLYLGNAGGTCTVMRSNSNGTTNSFWILVVTVTVPIPFGFLDDLVSCDAVQVVHVPGRSTSNA